MRLSNEALQQNAGALEGRENHMPHLNFTLPTPPEPFTGSLVSSDADWHFNACLDTYSGSWTIYAHGYLEAARALVSRVGQTKSSQDTLVYPIVFLFRQYIELTLKHLIVTTGELIDNTQVPGNRHSLHPLWERLLPLQAEMEVRMSQVVLNQLEQEEVGRILREFDVFDKRSYTFRYPVGRDGEPSLPAHLRHLNLRRFRDAMDRLAYLLDRLVMGAEYFYEYYGPGAAP